MAVLVLQIVQEADLVVAVIGDLHAGRVDVMLQTGLWEDVIAKYEK